MNNFELREVDYSEETDAIKITIKKFVNRIKDVEINYNSYQELQHISLLESVIIPFKKIIEYDSSNNEFYEKDDNEFNWAVLEKKYVDSLIPKNGSITIDLYKNNAYYFEDLEDALLYAYSEDLRKSFIGI